MRSRLLRCLMICEPENFSRKQRTMFRIQILHQKAVNLSKKLNRLMGYSWTNVFFRKTNLSNAGKAKNYSIQHDSQPREEDLRWIFPGSVVIFLFFIFFCKAACLSDIGLFVLGLLQMAQCNFTPITSSPQCTAQSHDSKILSRRLLWGLLESR